MNFKDVQSEPVIKLIKFSIGNRRFQISDAMNSAGIGYSEFVDLANIIYENRIDHNQSINIHEIREWNLKPEALFGYMSLKEFEHSVKSAKEAKTIAITAIIISGLLALGSIIVSLLQRG